MKYTLILLLALAFGPDASAKDKDLKIKQQEGVAGTDLPHNTPLK